MLGPGFPLVAFLQLVRVYGQALAQIADAEVRLFHLYVHEPLMRDGVAGLEMAEEMEGLARELLPLAAPIMDHLHQRFLQHFVEQDVVGHMEPEVDADGELDLGRLRVAIAFADLAGYTRLTEEAGEEQAVDIVERFVEAVANTLPDDARIIKTIGDEVMVVASDAAALLDWAVGFQELQRERPLPRIGIHHGLTLYRDGDYYGREVNLAARVARARRAARCSSRGRGRARGPHLGFERIGEVRLKGFSRVDRAVPREAGRGVSLEARVRDGGLLAPGRAVVVLLSGGPDSVCLLDLAVRIARGRGDRAARQLRAARLGGEDEAHCAALCERLGVPLDVDRPRRPGGQPAGVGARRALRRARGWRSSATPTSPPATRPPTRSRPCSTGSPPRRAGARCWACASATGRLVRPLLGGLTREETEACCGRARAAVARGPLQRRPRLRPQPRPPRPGAGAARAAPGRRGKRPAHARAAARRGRRARRRGRPPCSRRPARRRRSSTCARCRPRSPASPSGAWPTRPAGPPSRTARPRSSALAEHGALDLGDGLRARIEGGPRSSSWPTPAAGPRCRAPRLRPLVLRDEAIGEILVQADELQHRVRQLGAEITRDYAGRDLLLVGVLKGAVFFLSDLMRHIEVPCEVDFMAVASYGSLDRLLGRGADPQGPRRRRSRAATS